MLDFWGIEFNKCWRFWDWIVVFYVFEFWFIFGFFGLGWCYIYEGRGIYLVNIRVGWG